LESLEKRKGKGKRGEEEMLHKIHKSIKDIPLYHSRKHSHTTNSIAVITDYIKNKISGLKTFLQ
jgi:hypothetical protein